MPAYFTGRNVGSKKLTQASARNFPEFVAHHLDLPVTLPVTFDDFHKLGKKERNEVKCQTGYFVACTFPQSPWEGRLLEHAGACNLLCLDIDDPDMARPFVDSPALLKEKLGRFSFAAYKTISSTPEAPRLRVVVSARGVPVERYPDAVLTVAQMMGLSSVTRESAVPVQAMFRPAMFSDQDVDSSHPLIITCFEGEEFAASDIADDLETLPGMVSGSRRSHTRRSGDVVDDYLTYFCRPVDGITIEVAREALMCVDADCSYFEWIEMASALKHQFGGGDSEGDAYLLFDEWSEKGTKYAGQKDTAAKWKSFSEQPAGRAPITIRTLLKRAVESGWDAGQVKEECFQSVSAWISFECKTSTQLMSEGVKRIAATPLISHTEEDALLQMLASTARQKFEVRLTPAALRRDLKRLRESITVKKDADTEKTVPPWARGLCYVAATNTIHRQSTRQVFTLESFDNVYGRELLPSVEEIQKSGDDVDAGTLHTPMFKPSQYVLNHLKCQTVDDTDYDPSSPEKMVVSRDGKRYLNIYRISYKKSDKAYSEYAMDILFDHMMWAFKEPKYRTILMDWMAHNVQFPGVKIRWAPLLQGAEGCGKTFFAQCMRVVLGDDNVRLINKESIKKGWNEWTFGSQFVAIEEIRVAGHNRHDVMNSLKEPVTNDFITVNERNRSTRTVRNVTNYMAFTNHHDALALSDESRRWFVLKSVIQSKPQIQEKLASDPGYFVRLFDMLVTHGPGLRWFLENRTIQSDFATNGPAPHSIYLDEMIADTGNDLLSHIKRIWEEGENLYVRPDIIASGPLQLALDMEGVRNANPQYVASVLREAGFRKLDGRHILTEGGERQYVWVHATAKFDENPLDVLVRRVNRKATTEDDAWT